jgi:hypothetical protein
LTLARNAGIEFGNALVMVQKAHQYRDPVEPVADEGWRKPTMRALLPCG